MTDSRHDFVVVIPVADRPRHLADCLASLAELLRRYPYAGEVAVLVVDDSLDADSQARHRAIAAAGSGTALSVHYLGQDEQRGLVDALPAGSRAGLASVLGDGSRYGHKGASITRNIAYLWLNRLAGDARRRLFWFIDSDQEFRVNVAAGEGEEQPYAVDYFHALDRIFTETPTRILTGKVVGDPPVSPAVMAGNFLDDVSGFLADMAACRPEAGCTFHGAARQADDAAYHDMADLFGFKPAAEAWRYRCPIAGGHDHRACYADFAGRLGRFFDGEHPTRRSYYQADDVMAGVKPARTIYTGNYVFTPAGLAWFVPFADLKLRMAGPTLGRIIKAELGAAFVSANLPMLHKRTVAEIGQSEYRPGVERASGAVDLSGEFERQYYGDVMLFAMERLCESGYPGSEPGEAAVAEAVAATEAAMRERYRARQVRTAGQVEALDRYFGDPGQWWHGDQGLAAACDEFRHFIADMRRNFAADAPAWRAIESADHRRARLAAIAAAIRSYRDDRAAWQAALHGAAK